MMRIFLSFSARVLIGCFAVASVGSAGEQLPHAQLSSFDTSKRYTDANGNYSPEREAVHDRIIAELLKHGSSSATPRIILTAGAPGAGKTTVVDALIATKYIDGSHYLLIDGDEIKKALPEYDFFRAVDPKNATDLLYDESGTIKYKALTRAISQQKNIILAGTLVATEYISNYLRRLKSEHPEYKTTIIFVDADEETILRRVDSRALSTGRHIPRDDVIKAIRGVRQSFETIRPLTDGSLEISNDSRGMVVRNLFRAGTTTPVDLEIPVGADESRAKAFRDGMAALENSLHKSRTTKILDLATLPEKIPGPDYEGKFESHLTFLIDDPARLQEFRRAVEAIANERKLDLWPVCIELPEGEFQRQPMTTGAHAGSAAKVYLETKTIAKALVAQGFQLNRFKIEAVIGQTTGLPETSRDVPSMPLGNYYEFHVRINISNDVQYEQALGIARNHRAHLSRNAFSNLSDASRVYFVTLREYALGRKESVQKVITLRKELREAHLAVGGTVPEYSIFDTNTALDGGWLALPPATDQDVLSLAQAEDQALAGNETEHLKDCEKNLQ